MTKTNRHAGGQPGNSNAVKHGLNRAAAQQAMHEDQQFLRMCRDIARQMLCRSDCQADSKSTQYPLEYADDNPIAITDYDLRMVRVGEGDEETDEDTGTNVSAEDRQRALHGAPDARDGWLHYKL